MSLADTFFGILSPVADRVDQFLRWKGYCVGCPDKLSPSPLSVRRPVGHVMLDRFVGDCLAGAGELYDALDDPQPMAEVNYTLVVVKSILWFELGDTMAVDRCFRLVQLSAV